MRVASRLGRFARDRHGAALVEFAVSLPLVLVLFATIIEGGRLFWSYQETAAGVRDAARYLARVADPNACATGASMTGYSATLETIVRETSSNNSLFPSRITVTSVAPTLICVTGAYRISPTPVAQVTATLNVQFPFAGLFSFAGGSLNAVTTTVTDQSRVFGL